MSCGTSTSPMVKRSTWGITSSSRPGRDQSSRRGGGVPSSPILTITAQLVSRWPVSRPAPIGYSTTLAAMPPAMIIERPVRNIGQSVAPRHSIVPFQRGGGSPRHQRLTDGRMDAVGADQRRPAHRLGDGAVVVGERGRHAIVVLLEAGQPAVGADDRLAQALHHRVAEHALEHAAMDRELGHRVTGVQAAQLAPHLLAEPVHVDELVGAHRHRVQPLEQAERLKLSDRMRQRVDAHAQLADRGRLLEHAAGQPAPVQRQRGGQASDAAADDDDGRARRAGHGTIVPSRAATAAHASVRGSISAK